MIKQINDEESEKMKVCVLRLRRPSRRGRRRTSQAACAAQPRPSNHPPPPASYCCTPHQIQGELQRLTARLAGVNESLARKLAAKAEYDAVIAETEAAYLKILESSQTLLTVLKRESVGMAKRSGRAA